MGRLAPTESQLARRACNYSYPMSCAPISHVFECELLQYLLDQF
jgi:hypothetical protein